MVALESLGNSSIRDSTLCPHCSKTATGIDSIIEDFGLRNMSDGVTRVQSWCKECRNESREVFAK